MSKTSLGENAWPEKVFVTDVARKDMLPNTAMRDNLRKLKIRR